MVPTVALLSLIPVSVVVSGVAAAQDIVPSTSGLSHLYCGTDESGFEDMNGQLAEVSTNGPDLVGSVHLINLYFPLNGLTVVFDKLLAGQPEDVGSAAGNTLRTITVRGVVSTILPGSESFSPDCCDEQMVVAPDGLLYHAHYGDVIQQLGFTASGESKVLNTFAQTDVVGMASDGVQIWISKWDGREVGTWDPTTNIFTSVFSTPNNAGALAWDANNGVLWVGMEGGLVLPYNSVGQQLGPGFEPFGEIGDTVDGLAFIP